MTIKKLNLIKMTKGKLILLLIFIAVFLVSYIIGTFWGYNSIWDLWNVPTMSPHFADTRAITSGSEAYALGYDPLFNNVRDPWNRPMNLSRLWNLLFNFKINQSHTTFIGSIFIASFFISPFIFIKSLDVFTASILSLLFISPAIMLGVERATPDLFLFFILSLGIRIGYTSTIAGLCFILFAGFLKLFPVFGIGLILKENKSRFWMLFLATFSIFLTYLIVTFPDVKQMVIVTPKGTDMSYGANVLSLRLEHFIARNEFLNIVSFLPKILRLLVYVIILAFLGIIVKKQEQNPINTEKPKYIDAFRVGACIYIGTFIFGNNWDYRLMFLIFTVPQIACWIKQKHPQYFFSSSITLFATILSFWYLIIQAIAKISFVAYMLDEFCNWVVFSGLTYLFLASLPGWLTTDIEQISLLFKRKLRNFSGFAD